MSIYETIIIFRTTRIDTTTLKESIDKFKDMIQSFSKPKKIKMEELGEKKLAYEIKKETSGYYVVFTWTTKTSEDVAELERQLRVDDHVLKFITVRQDDDEDDVELDDLPESEQDHPAKEIPNALDIMLGLAKYNN